MAEVQRKHIDKEDDTQSGISVVEIARRHVALLGQRRTRLVHNGNVYTLTVQDEVMTEDISFATPHNIDKATKSDDYLFYPWIKKSDVYNCRIVGYRVDMDYSAKSCPAVSLKIDYLTVARDGPNDYDTFRIKACYLSDRVWDAVKRLNNWKDKHEDMYYYGMQRIHKTEEGSICADCIGSSIDVSALIDEAQQCSENMEEQCFICLRFPGTLVDRM